MKTFITFIYVLLTLATLTAQNSDSVYTSFNPKMVTNLTISSTISPNPLIDPVYVVDSALRYHIDTSLDLIYKYGYDAFLRRNYYANIYPNGGGLFDKNEEFTFYKSNGNIKLYKQFWDDQIIKQIKTEWYNNSFIEKQTTWLLNGEPDTVRYSQIVLVDIADTLHPFYKTYWWHRINHEWIYSKTYEYFYNQSSGLLDSILHYTENSLSNNSRIDRNDFTLKVNNYNDNEQLVSEYYYDYQTSNSDPSSWTFYKYWDDGKIRSIEYWGYTFWQYPELLSESEYDYYDFGKLKTHYEYQMGVKNFILGDSESKTVFYYDENNTINLSKYYYKSSYGSWIYSWFKKYFTSTQYVGKKKVINNTDNVIIYPNPAKNQFYFRIKAYDKCTIIIKNISGKTVKEESFPENKGEISVDNLPSGLYIVNFLIERIPFASKKIIIE